MFNTPELVPSKEKQTTKSTSYGKHGKCDKRCVYDVLIKTLKILIVSLLLIYVVSPVLFLSNPAVHVKLIFLNFVCWPPSLDVNLPAELGIKGARSFYLNVDSENRIGVWHILPESLITNDTDKYESLLQSGHPIFLYLHGSTGTRGGWHRVQLLKLLASMQYHVIAIDYRGYADSKGYPTEDGVVSDGHFIYKWIRERSADVPVIIWGHSLGAAITTELAKKLCESGEHPNGVILESPFNNMKDAALSHPFTAPYRHISLFKDMLLDTVAKTNIDFSSDKNIASVTSPLLIIHAKDDLVIPFELGEKLYQSALSNRPKGSGQLEFIALDAIHGYGHKHIFQAPELPSIIRKFVKLSSQKQLYE